MLSVVTLLWDRNEHSKWFSQCYSEDWVIRLRDGFRRNLTVPHRFVLFTDRARDLPQDITQERLSTDKPDYCHCIEPYKMGVPMILVGLDTVIVGNIDHLAKYCYEDTYVALPNDPYHPNRVCNGVALVPRGLSHIYEEWNGENDMEWMRKQPYKVLDLLFPGQIVSYKAHVKNSHHGIKNVRIVYMHGEEKPHQLTELPWIKQHWLGLPA